MRLVLIRIHSRRSTSNSFVLGGVKPQFSLRRKRPTQQHRVTEGSFSAGQDIRSYVYLHLASDHVYSSFAITQVSRPEIPTGAVTFRQHARE